MHQSVPTNAICAFHINLDSDCVSDDITYALTDAKAIEHYQAVVDVVEAEAAVTARAELSVVVLTDNIIVF